MSNRQHLDPESERVRALHAPAEATDLAPSPVTDLAPSPATTLEAAGRASEPPGRGGHPAVARLIDGLHASAGNGAVAWLLRGGTTRNAQRTGTPVVHAAHAAVDARPAVQREPDDEETGAEDEAADTSGVTDATTSGLAGDESATALGGGAPAAGPSWTKVGPPSPASYSVSGSLRTVATAVAARPEAGSVTVTPTVNRPTWTPDGGEEKVIAAQVTIAQVLELPVWSDKDKATKNQQAEWDRFHKAITAHENGHVGKDKSAFANVHTKMVGKSPGDADSAFDTVETQAKTDNKDYDTATNSGISQGTGINPNIDEVTKVP